MTLELYKKNSCPYCQRVMRHITEQLVSIGGKRQVPCLFIDGKPLYESLDIIKWLEEHPQQ